MQIQLFFEIPKSQTGRRPMGQPQDWLSIRKMYTHVRNRSVLSQSHKFQWKIVNNGTKQYVIFNYQYFLFVILYENRQYYYPAWSWLIVALFTICCWPSRPTFPFSLRSKGNVERLGQQQIVNWATMSQDRAG